MFFKITYWTYSGVNETTDTIEGASFFTKFLINYSLDK
jgi:hypothetical protein